MVSFGFGLLSEQPKGELPFTVNVQLLLNPFSSVTYKLCNELIYASLIVTEWIFPSDFALFRISQTFIPVVILTGKLEFPLDVFICTETMFTIIVGVNVGCSVRIGVEVSVAPRAGVTMIVFACAVIGTGVKVAVSVVFDVLVFCIVLNVGMIFFGEVTVVIGCFGMDACSDIIVGVRV